MMKRFLGMTQPDAEDASVIQEDMGRGDYEEGQAIKYDFPKIMLLDCDSDIEDVVKSRGYSVEGGSLGKPYSVKTSDSLGVFKRNWSFPKGHKEKDIVIIDTSYNLVDGGPPEDSGGVQRWWANESRGMVDPRVLSSYLIRDDFDRILDSGGFFVVFMGEVVYAEMILGKMGSYGRVSVDSEKYSSSHAFLSVLIDSSYVSFGNDHGEIVLGEDNLDRGSPLGSLIYKNIDNFEYDCTVKSGYFGNSQYVSIVKNKFGESLGGMILPHGPRKGGVLLLPQLKNKKDFIVSIIEDVIPGIRPDLFPDHDNTSWKNVYPYEIEQISVIKNKIEVVQYEANQKIAELDNEISEIGKRNKYIFDIVSETGDALVYAVRRALYVLGYKEVIDVDEDMDTGDVGGGKKEDLRIHDSSPTLIIEVKGINGYPSDDDSLAVQKYVTMRMREWNRTDITGLSVINHQRNLPPLDRNNDTPFRDDLVVSAEEQGIGLMTGWDLHKLVRSYVSNRWHHDNIKDLIYSAGRIDIVPNNYELIGHIERYIDKYSVVGIMLNSNLSEGDVVSFELPHMFVEQDCVDMQLDNVAVGSAGAGELVGLKTVLSKQEARVGVRVFRRAE